LNQPSRPAFSCAQHLAGVHDALRVERALYGPHHGELDLVPRHRRAAHFGEETDPARLRPNDVPVVEGDATRLRSELGWVPRFDLDQTLRETLDWWRAEVRAGT